MQAEHHFKMSDAADSVLVAMIAEVLLICATSLVFFVQLDLPIAFATGGALGVLFIGSLLCWKNQTAAGAILALSLLAIELILIQRFGVLLLPFAAVDIILVIVVSGFWHTGEHTS